MGVSTDGILAYGWDLGESEDNHWASEFLEDLEENFDSDTDAIILAKLGYDGPDEYKPQAEFLKGIPFEIITHCSCDYPMYILTLKDANWSASRGYPREIDISKFSDLGWRNEVLYEAAEKLGFNAQDMPAPRLLLASLWC